jgi:hypothetical protein
MQLYSRAEATLKSEYAFKFKKMMLLVTTINYINVS